MTASTGPDRHPDVLVIGAGVIGLASAWRLAQQGLDVEVVDPEPGSGASVVAAGMLAPVTEARLGEEALLELAMASWARWPDFAAELTKATERDVGYRADGTVVVALDADDRAALADLADRQRSMGLAVDDLAASELRRLEPALAPPVRRGVRAAGERSVDPPALVDALLQAAVDAGVRLRRRRVTGLLLSGGDTASGVELEGGDRVSAGLVVLAAGTWSGLLDSTPAGSLPAGVRPPVRPVKGQVVTLRQRPGDTVVHHTVRGYVHGAVVYLVPRDDGRVVCGATVEERGWDATVTAGGAYELLRDVLALFPGLDEAELAGVRAGFRPGTPDDLPVIGHTEVNRLITATGHYRNGILLTPITAEAVAGLVTGSGIPHEVKVCDPRRFQASLGDQPSMSLEGQASAGGAEAVGRSKARHAPRAVGLRPRGQDPLGRAQRGDGRSGWSGSPATQPATSSVAPPTSGHPAGAEAITVTVNGEARSVEGDLTLDELVDVLELDRQGLAIAVDDEVVPRSAWPERRLTERSRVEILTVAQGG
jgi:glycine oxidase